MMRIKNLILVVFLGFLVSGVMPVWGFSLPTVSIPKIPSLRDTVINNNAWRAKNKNYTSKALQKILDLKHANNNNTSIKKPADITNKSTKNLVQCKFPDEYLTNEGRTGQIAFKIFISKAVIKKLEPTKSKVAGISNCEQLYAYNIIQFFVPALQSCDETSWQDQICQSQVRDLRYLLLKKDRRKATLKESAIFNTALIQQVKLLLKQILQKVNPQPAGSVISVQTDRLQVVRGSLIEPNQGDSQAAGQDLNQNLMPRVINFLTIMAISVALVVLFIAAVNLIVAGTEEDLKKAGTTITYSIFGLVMIGLAYAVVKAILFVNFN